MRRIAFAALTALAFAAACGGASGPNIPQDATIALDREPIVLPAAYIGTEQNESLQIINQGRNALTVSNVRLAAADGGTLVYTDGGGVFSAASFSAPLPAQVPGLSAGFVAFTFKPTKPGISSALLVIDSNAPARGHLEVPVTACAVGLDAGVDAGC